MIYIYKARVLKVIDGDTVDIEIDLGFFTKVVKRARLTGIDAFEKNSRILSDREKAAKATSFLRNRIENRQVYVITQLDKSDKYGRVLVEIFESYDDMSSVGNSLNLKLVQEGLAVPYDGGMRDV